MELVTCSCIGRRAGMEPYMFTYMYVYTYIYIYIYICVCVCVWADENKSEERTTFNKPECGTGSNHSWLVLLWCCCWSCRSCQSGSIHVSRIRWLVGWLVGSTVHTACTVHCMADVHSLPWWGDSSALPFSLERSSVRLCWPAPHTVCVYLCVLFIYLFCIYFGWSLADIWLAAASMWRSPILPFCGNINYCAM